MGGLGVWLLVWFLGGSFYLFEFLLVSVVCVFEFFVRFCLVLFCFLDSQLAKLVPHGCARARWALLDACWQLSWFLFVVCGACLLLLVLCGRFCFGRPLCNASFFVCCRDLLCIGHISTMTPVSTREMKAPLRDCRFQIS